MIRDFNVEWLEAVEFIPAQAFQTYVTGAGISDGDPVFAEIAASGITGVSIAAAGDAIATYWHMGNHVDINKQIRFRAALSTSGGADVETVTVTYTPYVANTTVITDPVTALSTAIPAITLVAGDALNFTDFGKINRATLPSTTTGLGLKVAVSNDNASADEISLIGLEIRYTPRRTAGPRRNILGGRRLNVSYPLGVQLASTQEAL